MTDTDVDISLPPLFEGRVALSGSAFGAALEAVEAGEAETGDYFHVPSDHALDVAIILAPEVGRSRCQEMLILAAVAFGDAVGAIAPPEVSIQYRWPDIILANRAHVGRVKMAMGEGTSDETPPDWLVIGLEVAVRPDESGPEPGMYVDRTTLFNEGCVDETVTDWKEAFARHLLVWIHDWQDRGFGPVHDMWWGRCDPRFERVSFRMADGTEAEGEIKGMDEHGCLLVKKPDGGMHLLYPPDAVKAGGDD